MKNCIIFTLFLITTLIMPSRANFVCKYLLYRSMHYVARGITPYSLIRLIEQQALGKVRNGSLKQADINLLKFVGSDINSHHGEFLLDQAITFHQSDAVILLLANGADIHNCLNNPARTAIYQGQSDILSILLVHGLNPHRHYHSDDTGEELIILASRLGHESCLSTLLTWLVHHPEVGHYSLEIVHHAIDQAAQKLHHIGAERIINMLFAYRPDIYKEMSKRIGG